MKPLFLLLCLLTQNVSYGQYNPKNYFAFDGKKQVVFIDEFQSPLSAWGFEENLEDYDEKYRLCIIPNKMNYVDGKRYLYNYCVSEISDYAEVDIDYNRNFEIVFIAKICYNDTDTKIKRALLAGI
jgi:hypothetical protein